MQNNLGECNFLVDERVSDIASYCSFYLRFLGTGLDSLGERESIFGPTHMVDHS